MVFSAMIFLFCFLPLTLFIYFIVAPKFRNGWLLFMSLIFYFLGEHKYIVLMLISIIINYSCGIFIHVVRNRSIYIRRVALAFSITLNLGVLFWFKYLDFGIDIFNSLFSSSIPLKNIALPIGISFFTFQGMTYIMDLYRGNVNVQKNPLKVALYISLFPQLIAGPIVRYKDIASQIESRAITLDKFHLGVSRFIVGLGKKTIIANNVAVIADNIFNQPIGTFTASTAWLGVVAYTFQIYFDFSGYSDMAIGLGHMFGFDFLENFNYPYISSSIREFWRRWHISLSSFFRDYLYIPLGGNRRGNVYVNLILVFFATGLWHGAGLHYIAWGLWHGFFIIIETILRRRPAAAAFLKRIRNPVTLLLARIYTLLVVVFGWVIFRSDGLTYAVRYMKQMVLFESGTNVKVSALFYLDSYNTFVLIIAALFSFPLAHALRTLFRDRIFRGRQNAYGALRLVCLAALLFWSAVSVISQGYNPFIYFRF